MCQEQFTVIHRGRGVPGGQLPAWSHEGRTGCSAESQARQPMAKRALTASCRTTPAKDLTRHTVHTGIARSRDGSTSDSAAACAHDIVSLVRTLGAAVSATAQPIQQHHWDTAALAAARGSQQRCSTIRCAMQWWSSKRSPTHTFGLDRLPASRCMREHCPARPPRPPPPPTHTRAQRVIIYPNYLNAKKTVAEGRRIPADKGAGACEESGSLLLPHDWRPASHACLAAARSM